MPVSCVVDLAGPVASHKGVDAAFDHLIDFARSQIDGGDSMGIRDHQLLSVCRVRILVKIERSSAVFARKTDHAMAGVGIDPLRRQRGLADSIRIPARVRKRDDA